MPVSFPLNIADSLHESNTLSEKNNPPDPSLYLNNLGSALAGSRRDLPEPEDAPEDRGPVQDGAWDPHESPRREGDGTEDRVREDRRREERRRGRRQGSDYPGRPERGSWSEQEGRRGHEAIPEGWQGYEDSVPRPLEVGSITNKSAWRQQIGSGMRIHGGDKTASRWEDCGKLVRSACSCGWKGEQVRAYRCESRVCPECSRKAAEGLHRELFAAVLSVPRQPGFAWRHITLTTVRDAARSTIGEDVQAVREGLKRIQAVFKKGGKWRWSSFAAYYGIEIGKESGMVHVHLMCYAPFIDRQALQDRWGLGRLAIKPVLSERQIWNVSAYALDMTNLADWPPERVIEVWRAFHGVRRLGAWGMLYRRVRLTREKVKAPACPCCGLPVSYEFVREDRETGPPGSWS